MCTWFRRVGLGIYLGSAGDDTKMGYGKCFSLRCVPAVREVYIALSLTRK